DGSVWATGGGREARRLDPDKVEFKFYEAPAAKTHKNPGAYGIAIAGDGAVWFAEDEADLMARVDPVTGKIDEYKIPYEGRVPAPDEQRRERRPLGRAVECRQADEGRSQDQGDDALHAAYAVRRQLLGHRRQEEQLRLGQPAPGRHDRPLRSEDAGV